MSREELISVLRYMAAHSGSGSMTSATIAEAAAMLEQDGAKVARLREALFSIESYCPEYTGDYTSNATLSDFGGNADDYAREMNAITDAHIGDIARAALKDTA